MPLRNRSAPSHFLGRPEKRRKPVLQAFDDLAEQQNQHRQQKEERQISQFQRRKTEYAAQRLQCQDHGACRQNHHRHIAQGHVVAPKSA